MLLPSIDNVSTLCPVSRIAKTVPLYLLQRRALFLMPGSWAVGSYITRASIHEFITLTTLFAVGPDTAQNYCPAVAMCYIGRENQFQIP